jgi:hypothetical protein
MSLASLGSLASGIGSVASAFGGGGDFSSKDYFSQLKLNYRDMQRRLTNLPSAMVKGAQLAGLHPLTAMGVNVGSGTATPVIKNGPDFAQMGQGIDRALSAGQDKLTRQLQELALEKAGLENDYLRTQIAGSQKQLLQTGRPPVLPSQSDYSHINGVDSSGIRRVDSESVASIRGNRGIEAGANPFDKKFYLDNDTFIKLPPGQSIDELGYPMSIFKSAELTAKKGGIYFKNRIKKQKKAWKAWKEKRYK